MIDPAKAPRLLVQDEHQRPEKAPSASLKNKRGDVKARPAQPGRLVSNTKKRQAQRVRVIHQFNPSLDISGGLSYLPLVSSPTGLV